MELNLKKPWSKPTISELGGPAEVMPPEKLPGLSSNSEYFKEVVACIVDKVFEKAGEFEFDYSPEEKQEFLEQVLGIYRNISLEQHQAAVETAVHKIENSQDPFILIVPDGGKNFENNFYRPNRSVAFMTAWVYDSLTREAQERTTILEITDDTKLGEIKAKSREGMPINGILIDDASYGGSMAMKYLMKLNEVLNPRDVNLILAGISSKAYLNIISRFPHLNISNQCVVPSVREVISPKYYPLWQTYLSLIQGKTLNEQAIDTTEPTNILAAITPFKIPDGFSVAVDLFKITIPTEIRRDLAQKTLRIQNLRKRIGYYTRPSK